MLLVLETRQSGTSPHRKQGAETANPSIASRAIVVTSRIGRVTARNKRCSLTSLKSLGDGDSLLLDQPFLAASYRLVTSFQLTTFQNAEM